MLIKINITREVLERTKFCGIDKETGCKLTNSKANLGRNCGISDAICDLLPTAWVSSNKIWVYRVVPTFDFVMAQTSKSVDIELPPIAQSFISIFDSSTPEQRAAMQPISFEIEVPDSVIDRIGIEQVTEILATSQTLERV